MLFRSPAQDVARFALLTIADVVCRATKTADSSLPVLFSGGVSASVFLRQIDLPDREVCFAQEGLSGDNAVGAAVRAAIQEGLLCP